MAELPASSWPDASLISQWVWSGSVERAARYSREVLAANPPPRVGIVYQIHRAFLSAGDIDGAAALMPQLLASDLEPISKALVKVRQACAENRVEDATQIYESLGAADGASSSERWHMLQLLGREEEARQQLAYMDTPEYFNALSSFLVYPNFDIHRYPNLEKVLLDQGIHRAPPRPESYACPREAAAKQASPAIA